MSELTFPPITEEELREKARAIVEKPEPDEPLTFDTVVDLGGGASIRYGEMTLEHIKRLMEFRERLKAAIDAEFERQIFELEVRAELSEAGVNIIFSGPGPFVDDDE